MERVHLRKDGQPPLSGRAEDRHVRSARRHRLLGRDDVGRGLLGDPPVEHRVQQELAARDRPREHAQVGERDASGRLEYGRAPIEEFENWDYAASRYHSSPFAWINAGPLESPYDDTRPPSYVQTQLTAMRKFGMGGGFANYHHGGGLTPSRYAPYADALRAAAMPGNVDATAPTLDAAAGAASIQGTAHDNLAVWAVRWRDDLGGSGIAELDFTITQGDMLYIKDWRMNWSVPEEALTDGASSVTGARRRHQAQHVGPRVVVAGQAAAASRGRRGTAERHASALATSSAGKRPGRRECAATGGVVRRACHVASRLRLCASSPPALPRAVAAMAIPSAPPDEPSPPSTEPARQPAAGAADRLIFWADCERVAALTDDELDFWEESGVDGFVCGGPRLRGLGGHPGLHRRGGRGRSPGISSSSSERSAIGDRRASRGARDEDVPGRLPLELQEHGYAAG